MRSLLLVCFLGLVLSACGSGAPPDSGDQQTPAPGGGGNPGGGGSPGGGGGGTPPTPAVVLDGGAVDLGHPGGFPSDLIFDAQGMLITVDDAQIPARIVGYASSVVTATPTFSITLGAGNLKDHDGAQPARTPTAFGNGLFGAFTGDLELVSDRWLFVTVGGGNSTSSDGSGPLRLANLVLIDLSSQAIVQTINLAWELQHSGQISQGGPFLTVPQSLPSMVAFVPARNGTPTGEVYVAMSNGAGTTAGLQTFYNGTVQSFRADFAQPQPLSIDSTGKASLDFTRTYVSNHYNPVGFTRYDNAATHATLILTTAGGSKFDANFVAQPTSDAYLEFLDLERDDWRDDWEVNLGPILPAPHPMAFGKDKNGVFFGALTSQTFAAAYFVELTGLESNPVDPVRLRFLRAVDLEPLGAATAGSGFQPGLALSQSGRTLLLTSFTKAGVTVLGLPDDIEFGQVVVDPAPFDGANLGPLQSSLGALVTPPHAAADAFFVVNGTFDPVTFAPLRSSFLGTLTVNGGLP